MGPTAIIDRSTPVAFGRHVEQGPRALIFLDMDGVLNSLRSMIAFQGARPAHLDTVAIRLLNRLCLKLGEAGMTPAVVISSTWRMMHTKLSWWNALWAEHGCTAVHTIGATPIFQDNEPNRRGREVAQWMERHGDGDPYVCLDDDADFLPDQPLVLIDYEYGLQVAHINEAYRLLRGEPMPGLPRVITVTTLPADGSLSQDGTTAKPLGGTQNV